MSSTPGGLDLSRAQRAPAFELTASRQFTAWLAEQKTSLAFTTYQAGKLFLLGLQPDGRLSIFNRTFERCMGLWASPERLLMSTLYQLWRFDNALAPGQTHQGYDRLYVPQLAWTTGDLDVHDIAVAGNGGPTSRRAAAAGRCSSTRCSAASPRSARATASPRSGSRPSSASSPPRIAVT